MDISAHIAWTLQPGKGQTKSYLNPLTPSDAVRQQKKIILEDLFSSVLSQFKKSHPSGNLKFKNLGIFKSLKFRILKENSFQFLLSYISLPILSAVMG